MTLHHFHAQIWSFPQTILHFLFKPTKGRPPAAAESTGAGAPIPSRPCSHHVNTEEILGREEVELVMEKLGISCDPRGEKLQERVGSDEIEAWFDEEGVRMEDVREAFDVFDENRDGFIAAIELQRVLCALGFGEVSQVECQRMIGCFDDNGDGRIDLGEFLKLLGNC